MALQFKASIWIDEDGVKLQTISGNDVDMDFVRYMDAHADDPYVLMRFAGMKQETPYAVLGRYWWEDGEFDIEITSYVEIAIDAADINRLCDWALHQVSVGYWSAIPF